ncbi:MAG TPA: hypothetical protein VG406_11815 [Isosphaeraceae bacterium]|jgi:hypothetical protein|nr:hypothetical protein [Isosphaeraceae bacterium]
MSKRKQKALRQLIVSQRSDLSLGPSVRRGQGTQLGRWRAQRERARFDKQVSRANAEMDRRSGGPRVIVREPSLGEGAIEEASR